MLVVITYAMLAIVAALAFERFGLMSSGLAWVMGAVVFLIAGQAHAAAARAEERRATEKALHELRAANLSLIEELELASARIEEVETQLATQPARPSAQITPATYARSAVPARDEGPGDELLNEILQKLEMAGAGPAANVSSSARVELIRDALDANRVDLYLQPVVGLPQRRTYFYEGFTRLRDAKGNVVTPAGFLKAAEEHGLIAEVDNLLLLRCVQIVRKLTKSDRRVGIFCNISVRSLTDEEFFPPFLDFLRRNSDLATSLIFEMPQAAFDGRSSVAARHMARLADYGFRFSIDQVSNLNLDLAELQRAGVRFAKVEGVRLIEMAGGHMPVAGREPGTIAPEDIASLFARYGVDIIAEKIETEAMVVEILDLDIAYGQGHLFGAPRPVREDVLSEGGAEARRAG
ncbi:diguanylate phosphodiesterase [Glycocaulis alkaliphilus]|uniref:Diguanylate phosphodiesterase n=1 Tax=Glycocaulis alkaliphilus TaxID=1434191 RepID=A0A3T0EB89_9PROT|nr:EAL domain-containing protein [Glycocaulis alkaliphilus]AZU04745.1 diguanylate phosphodiesterase [Glycocaulis alkaliphilus]GGB67997.1 diguanylate phosphodiesterase [Glycocaulis alkaliphilus]